MNHLLSGTVTFLFTDIEGSTKLVREHSNAYGSPEPGTSTRKISIRPLLLARASAG